MVGNGAQGSVQDVRAAALELPSNWTTVWSQSKKQIYYFNTATSESTWILPGAQAADQDPGEWAHVLSESKKKYYWFNTLTGESVWEQPDAATTTACRDQDSTKNAIPLKHGCTGLQLSEGWPHAVAGGHTSVVDKKFLPPDASGYSNPPIMLGDRIVEVDSEDASQLTSADVLRKLAGPINSTVEIKLSRKTGAERYRVCLLRQSALVQSTSDQSTLANRPSTPRVRTLQPSTPRGSPHTSDALEQTHPDRENSSTDRKNAVNDNQGLSVDITLKLGLSFSVVGRGEHQHLVARDTLIQTLVYAHLLRRHDACHRSHVSLLLHRTFGRAKGIRDRIEGRPGGCARSSVNMLSHRFAGSWQRHSSCSD